jgi:hypothetical protein
MTAPPPRIPHIKFKIPIGKTLIITSLFVYTNIGNSILNRAIVWLADRG